MADDALDEILRLVAEGRLSAEEAAPLLDALDATTSRAGASASPGEADDAAEAARSADRPPRALRIRVSDDGRDVVNLRIPLALGRMGFEQIPGISPATSDRISEAIAAGIKGSILDIDDAGSAVRISIE